MAVLMGLLSALCWGATDYLAGAAARGFGVLRSVFWLQAFGMAVLSPVLFTDPTLRAVMAAAPVEAWSWGLLAAVANFASTLALTKALAIGKAALVAPIATTYGAVTTLLALISGEEVGSLALTGLALCILGVPLVTPSEEVQRQPRTPRGAIHFALLASLCLGVGLWLQGLFALPRLGSLPVLWLYYVLSAGGLLLLLLSRSTSILPPSARGWAIFAMVSLLSLGGRAALALGAAMTGAVAVVTVLSTLSGGITALLGVILRGERLTRWQGLGVTAILAGVVLLRLDQ
jgi:drug/metabolite transporter (DMT)-like permease